MYVLSWGKSICRVGYIIKYFGGLSTELENQMLTIKQLLKNVMQHEFVAQIFSADLL